jgi:polyphosphate kinase 2 (PPK2 family)
VAIESKLDKKETEHALKEAVKAIHHQSDELYAQHGESLMVLLEGDNADGKDGMLKHVFQLNPQTTSGTHAFKAASGDEKKHEANWRIMQNLPGPGQIGFHNRSAYGDVVFAAKTEAEKAQREADIKEMEYGLTMGLPMTAEGHIALPDSHGRVDPSSIQRPPMRFIKVLLNVSTPEQAARLAARLTDEHKLYKESQADIDGHPQHNAVQSDFANAMAADSTPWAPTYVIPNDNKETGWRKMAQITEKVLDDIDPKRPPYQGNLDATQREAAARPLRAEVAEALNKHHHHHSG